MVFTVAGILFVMIFGAEIAYQEFFPEHDPELEGHPVRMNDSLIIPVVGISIFYSSYDCNRFLVYNICLFMYPDGKPGSFESGRA